MEKVSLIIPCYNEEAVLPILYKALEEVYQTLKEKYYLEYIFVDDGSSDKTLKLLKEFGLNDSKVKYISFSRNFGKEAAMYAGLSHADGDFVTIMDADMQDPPSLLPKMLEILENEDYDSVATRRATRKGEPKLRSFFAKKFYRIMNSVTDCDVVSGARDFRLMKRKMVDVIVSMTEHERFSKGIFGYVGFKTYWLSYDNIERAAGKTKWNFFRLFKYSIEGITDFSKVPLYLSFISSFVFALISLGLFITSIVLKVVKGYSMQSFINICALVLILASFLLLHIGIVSIYIAKINKESKNRPHFIVGDSNIKDFKRVG